MKRSIGRVEWPMVKIVRAVSVRRAAIYLDVLKNSFLLNDP